MSFSILEVARDQPDQLALVLNDRRYTFAHLAELVEREIAQGLPGSQSEMPSKQSPPMVIDCSTKVTTYVRLLAAFELSIPAFLLDRRWSQEERARMVGLFGLQTASLDSQPEYGESSRFASGSKRRDAETCLATVATSGSSGRAKLAVLSHRAFAAAARSSAENLGWRSNDRWLLSLPLSHVGGLSVVTRCLGARKPVVWQVSERFDAEQFAELVASHRATLASVVPTMLERILQLPRSVDLSSLRAVLVGGASCPRELLEEAGRRRIPVLRTYGSTESCSQIATQRFSEHENVDAPDQGLPVLPGIEARIRSGLIEIRGASLFSGYVGETKRNAADWFRTSDRGTIDASGNLIVEGRADSMISSGGELVAPTEVEELIAEVAGVDWVMVFGVPHAEWGEAIVFAVSIDERHSVESVLESIDRHCRIRLASYKRPKEVAVLVDRDPPLLPNGKLDRKAVLELPRTPFVYPCRGPI